MFTEKFYSGPTIQSPNQERGRYNEEDDDDDDDDVNRSTLVALRCENCGVRFSDTSALADHRMLCGGRAKILMPYDPPANGFLHNGFPNLAHTRPVVGDRTSGKDFSDDDGVDDKEDFDSLGEESRVRRRNDFDNGDDDDDRPEEDYHSGGFKRKLSESSPDVRVKSQMRSDENFILGLRNRMVNSLNSFKDRRLEDLSTEQGRHHEGDDDDDNDDEKDNVESQMAEKRRRFTTEEAEEDEEPSRRRGPNDPAVIWALKAAQRGMFGDLNNVSLEPLAATRAAVSQQSMLDSPSTGRGGGLPGHQKIPHDREGLPEEVNMFRSMLFQLQQQQFMQIQMIQEMRRQLISSGVDPKQLPADMDLNMMTSEGLASVGAAMSGLQAARNGGSVTAPGAAVGAGSLGQMPKGFNFPDLITSSRAHLADNNRRPSREPSPSADARADQSKDGDDGAQAQCKQASDSDQDKERSANRPNAESDDVRNDEIRNGPPKISTSLPSAFPTPADLTQKYLNLAGSNLSPFSGLLASPSLQSSSSSSSSSVPPPGRNPLEILQEKTAASLSALPLPASLGGLRPPHSSATTSASPAFPGSEPKPYTSSSSMLNSSALFASSPSLSALQKETDALKPSPILPPISLPMTPEAYKGYIQRGTREKLKLCDTDKRPEQSDFTARFSLQE
ncbi:hypothetical protein PoB_000680400 [Plakobranchus ocellatus]|uniref:C2H2-type domain-containing protein n=1 Tax=Plakobranchus ocellatus TaxID=259542 RepID=A0AAV3YDG5_9GAST|nr:hypothetical protein PoB_000680400 [Plakobranchus ocellatus]